MRRITAVGGSDKLVISVYYCYSSCILTGVIFFEVCAITEEYSMKIGSVEVRESINIVCRSSDT